MVTNIVDTTADGIINITADKTNWTNKDVIVDISYTPHSDQFKKKYRIGTGSWQYVTNNTKQLIITENTSIFAAFENNAGVSSTPEVLNIQNIDKVAPDIGNIVTSNITENSVTADVNGSSDNLSGIKEYEFYLDGILKSTQISNVYVYTNLAIESSYNLTYKIYDNAGNVTNISNDKIIYIPDPNYNILKGVNKPRLAGMTPIIIENNGTVSPTIESDTNWYDYKDQGVHRTDGKTSIWANAQTNDGSQFVWIPRYAYKILSGEHTNTAGQIDVIFLKGKKDKYMLNGVEASLPAGYIVHPAFTFGSDKLTGIWVAKYEASNNNGKVKIAPNVASWTNINIANIFDNCYTMAADPTYVFTGLTNGNTHMMKNIEWGAVAYLTHSKYGRNGNEITINNSSGCITGSAGNSVSAAENVGTTAYNTAGGYLASTTGNISGIYDMSGGADEFTLGNTNSLSNAGSATNFDRIWNDATEKIKYFDMYDGYNNKIKGDAVYETSSSIAGSRNFSWFKDKSYFIETFFSWFIRGGAYYGTDSGIFAFDSYSGNASSIGFRPVLFVP